MQRCFYMVIFDRQKLVRFLTKFATDDVLSQTVNAVTRAWYPYFRTAASPLCLNALLFQLFLIVEH
jgi:hypothetical protein